MEAPMPPLICATASCLVNVSFENLDQAGELRIVPKH